MDRYFYLFNSEIFIYYTYIMRENSGAIQPIGLSSLSRRNDIFSLIISLNYRSRFGMPEFSYLSSVERRLLAALHEIGFGVRGIARRLKRSPSTISRELRRNRPE